MTGWVAARAPRRARFNLLGSSEVGIRCGLLIEDQSGSGEPAKQVRYPPDVIRNTPKALCQRR